jgi:hypothetical protein
VLGMGQDARLKDGGKIVGGHLVDIGLGSKHG